MKLVQKKHHCHWQCAWNHPTPLLAAAIYNMNKPKVHHTHTQRTGHEACTHMLYTSHPETNLKDTLGENPHHWKSHFFLFSFLILAEQAMLFEAGWRMRETSEHQSRKSKTLCQSRHQLTTASGRAEKRNALSQIRDGTNVCADCRALKCYRTNNASGNGHVTSFQFHQEVKWEELFPCQMKQTC